MQLQDAKNFLLIMFVSTRRFFPAMIFTPRYLKVFDQLISSLPRYKLCILYLLAGPTITQLHFLQLKSNIYSELRALQQSNIACRPSTVAAMINRSSAYIIAPR